MSDPLVQNVVIDVGFGETIDHEQVEGALRHIPCYFGIVVEHLIGNRILFLFANLTRNGFPDAGSKRG